MQIVDVPLHIRKVEAPKRYGGVSSETLYPSERFQCLVGLGIAFAGLPDRAIPVCVGRGCAAFFNGNAMIIADVAVDLPLKAVTRIECPLDLAYLLDDG